jgi:hypothetical protein
MRTPTPIENLKVAFDRVNNNVRTIAAKPLRVVYAMDALKDAIDQVAAIADDVDFANTGSYIMEEINERLMIATSFIDKHGLTSEYEKAMKIHRITMEKLEQDDYAISQEIFESNFESVEEAQLSEDYQDIPDETVDGDDSYVRNFDEGFFDD